MSISAMTSSSSSSNPSSPATGAADLVAPTVALISTGSIRTHPCAFSFESLTRPARVVPGSGTFTASYGEFKKSTTAPSARSSSVFRANALALGRRSANRSLSRVLSPSGPARGFAVARDDAKDGMDATARPRARARSASLSDDSVSASTRARRAWTRVERLRRHAVLEASRRVTKSRMDYLTRSSHGCLFLRRCSRRGRTEPRSRRSWPTSRMERRADEWR